MSLQEASRAHPPTLLRPLCQPKSTDFTVKLAVGLAGCGLSPHVALPTQGREVPFSSDVNPFSAGLDPVPPDTGGNS